MAGFVDFGPEVSQAQESTFTPCEKTVRMCIEALPNMGTGKHPHSLAALRALLPKPDRTEELLNAITKDGEEMDADHRHSMRTAIRRLIERGEIDG